MQLPSDFKYTHCHRWVKMKGEDYVTVGISNHAQELLGDIVYVENPPAGTVLQFEHALRYDGIGQDCFRYSCSASGTVEAINIKLGTSPEQVNESPYEAWFSDYMPTAWQNWEV